MVIINDVIIKCSNCGSDNIWITKDNLICKDCGELIKKEDLDW